MEAMNGTAGIRGWIAHRLFANYWVVPLLAIITAPGAAYLTLYGDGHGGTPWLLGRGLTPVATAETARVVTSTLLAVNTALYVLYLSLVLLVLTLAAGNLGVRLVDRWLDKNMIKVSIAGLSFSVVFTAIIAASIDATAPLERTPLISVAMCLILLAVNLGMLGVALQDLARTMHVDRAISSLADDIDLDLGLVSTTPFAGSWATQVGCPKEGYIEGLDIERLAKTLKSHDGAVRVCIAQGQHVLRGEPAIMFEHIGADHEDVLRCVVIGHYRSDAQGAVFRIRLLVEIGMRALSPSVNDLYTALACADRLADALDRNMGSYIGPGETAAFAGDPRIELAGQGLAGLFDVPLKGFRHAAASQPIITMRMIENYRRLIDRAASHGHGSAAQFFCNHARDLARQGATQATLDADRQAIQQAYEKVEQAMQGIAA